MYLRLLLSEPSNCSTLLGGKKEKTQYRGLCHSLPVPLHPSSFFLLVFCSSFLFSKCAAPKKKKKQSSTRFFQFTIFQPSLQEKKIGSSPLSSGLDPAQYRAYRSPVARVRRINSLDTHFTCVSSSEKRRGVSSGCFSLCSRPCASGSRTSDRKTEQERYLALHCFFFL